MLIVTKIYWLIDDLYECNIIDSECDNDNSDYILIGISI